MQAEPGGGRLLATVLLVPVALLLALTLAAWPAWRIELPLWDLWPYAGPAFDAFDPAVILRSHNEHVPATSALVLWLDRWLAAGTYVLAQGVELALLVFPAAWAASRAWRLAPIGGERAAAAALWVITLASVAALQTASHPFLLPHLLFTALALAAAALWLPPERPPSWPAVLLASLLAMAAVLTQANGISLPFALLLLEGLRRRQLPDPWRGAALLLPALLLFAAFYVLRDAAPQLGRLQPPDLLLFVDFLLRLAGAAAGLGLGSEAMARLAGLLLAVLALPPGLVLLLRPGRLLGDRLGAATAALYLVTLGGLVASAYARADSFGSALHLKYGYYSLLLAGLLAYLNGRLLPARWRRLWLLAAVAALLLVNAALLWRAPHNLERPAQQLRAEAAGYVFLLDTPAFCRVAECGPDHLAVLAHWRQHGLNVFAWPEAQRLGKPSTAGAAPPLPDCAGGIDALTPLAASDGTLLWRVDGWIGSRLAPREALLFVAEDDPQRPVLGFGFAADLAHQDAQGLRQPWRGYLAPGNSKAVAAVLPAGPCRLGLPAPPGD